MRVTHMTYARVAHDATPGDLVERPHDAEVDAFLLGHLEALQLLARKDDAPYAYFFDADCEKLFADLKDGSNADFLSSASQLAQRLVGHMDRRATAGLLLCIRAREESTNWAAAMKLEVVTANAAVLNQLESGEMVLAAAKNVLDAPGKLQKGAVVDDPRSASAVIIGDKLARESAYFPTALGIRTQQRAADAAVDVVRAIQQIDAEAGQEVVRVLPQIQPGPIDRVLTSVGEHIPRITEAVQGDIVSTLRASKRPVEYVDTAVPIRAIVRADGISVIAPASKLDDSVFIEPDPQGGWRIVIHVEDEPQVTIKR
jgi:hypothetical protein